jgi:hypothetical protein
MLGIFLVSQKKQKTAKVVEKKVAEKFVKNNPKEKEVTLREKLMGIEKKVEVQPEEKKPEEVKEEKIVNKIDFLKDFKDFDPDNSKGEEKQSSVEVSLTSKK